MKDELYQVHSMALVKDVFPREDLKGLINIFMIDSGINMGSEFTTKSLDRVIFIVEEKYKYLPIYIVASGFTKGSMGQYGPGRLVPRVIGEWMNQISQEYNREQAHEVIRSDDYTNSADLNKCPLGSAIIKKLDWFHNGTLPMSCWDRVPLKELADKIKAGEYVTASMFIK